MRYGAPMPGTNNGLSPFYITFNITECVLPFWTQPAWIAIKIMDPERVPFQQCDLIWIQLTQLKCQMNRRDSSPYDCNGKLHRIKFGHRFIKNMINLSWRLAVKIDCPIRHIKLFTDPNGQYELFTMYFTAVFQMYPPSIICF